LDDFERRYAGKSVEELEREFESKYANEEESEADGEEDSQDETKAPLDPEIVELMRAMDEEFKLATRGARPGKARFESEEDEEDEELDDEDEPELEDDDPDYMLLKNVLDSYKAQGGAAGPFSTILQ
jgi:hypothetical protein